MTLTIDRIDGHNIPECIFERIFDLLTNESSTLCSCCRTSKTIGRFASRVLYRKVHISSVFDIRLVGDIDNIKYFDAFASSCLPWHACHVREVEITGSFSRLSSPSTSTTAIALEKALLGYINLSSFIWQPVYCDNELTLSVLTLLSGFSSLRYLVIKAPYVDFSFSLPPSELAQLQRLTLGSANSNVLLRLPASLMDNNNSLDALCLEDDCGSVTPGILRSLIPVLQSVRLFALGVAYSVKYEDLFEFLGSLPNLRHLKLFHYTQLSNPLHLAILLPLQSLTVIHSYTNSRANVTNMCKWIRRLTSSAVLEELELVCDDADEHPGGPHISYDGLVEHLTTKHHGSLRSLRMNHAFIGIPALRNVFTKCRQLEELSITTRIEIIELLGELLNTATKLRSLSISIVNIKKKLEIGLSTLEPLLQRGSTALRHISINDLSVQGEWRVRYQDNEFQPEFSINA